VGQQNRSPAVKFNLVSVMLPEDDHFKLETCWSYV